MEIVYKIIDIAAFFTGWFLVGWTFILMKNLISIIVNKLKKNEMPQEDYKLFNPIYVLSQFLSGDKVKNSTKVVGYILFAIGIIGIILQIITYTDFGSDTIGSYIERREYTTYYYVNMFPEKNDVENYRVKALINSVMVKESDENGEHSERHYYIEKAYFDYGNFITFYDYGEEKTLEVNKKVRIEDDDGNYWRLELTNMKAN